MSENKRDPQILPSEELTEGTLGRLRQQTKDATERLKELVEQVRSTNDEEEPYLEVSRLAAFIYHKMQVEKGRDGAVAVLLALAVRILAGKPIIVPDSTKPQHPTLN